MDSRSNASYAVKEFMSKSGRVYSEIEFIDAVNKVTSILKERELAGQDVWMFLYYVSRMGPEYEDRAGGA